MMSHMNTSGTFLFPIDNRNILMLLCGTSFLIDGRLHIDGLCLLRSLMSFQGEIPGSKTPLQIWTNWVIFDGRV